jgi:XTP/dITP diphosphohydrolase
MRHVMTDSPRRDLLLASTNAGKIRELARLLDGVPVNLRTLTEFPQLPVAEESGETFEANASIKAEHYGRLSGLLTLADDSGLEVAALGGRPGVRSARYAGEDASDRQKMMRLLEELRGSADQGRRARFVCVMALYDPATEALNFFRGICRGRIAADPRGTGGFGYDPVFIPRGYDVSFAELPSQVKEQISHRAGALSEARRFILTRYASASLAGETAR